MTWFSFPDVFVFPPLGDSLCCTITTAAGSVGLCFNSPDRCWWTGLKLSRNYFIKISEQTKRRWLCIAVMLHVCWGFYGNFPACSVLFFISSSFVLIFFPILLSYCHNCYFMFFDIILLFMYFSASCWTTHQLTQKQLQVFIDLSFRPSPQTTSLKSFLVISFCC